MNQAALNRSRLTVRALIGVACLGGLLTACGEDASYRDKVYGTNSGPARPGDRDAGGSDAGSEPTKSAKGCAPAIASDHLPAREAVMSEDVAGASSDQGVFTKALFDEFVQHCGSCHAGTTSQGGLSANFGNFPQKIGADALARIRSNQLGVGGFMPPSPSGRPFSERPEGDPIRSFAARLEQWIQQGRPADVFFPNVASSGSSAGPSPYLLTKSVGMQLTNLANCVPAPDLMATERSTMAELDAKFAGMNSFSDLPKSLRDTDLTSLDAEVLARRGVIPFAPAYTLWADNAKKIRMVRVPDAQSIRFDRDTQSFDIPANTRFYKTFLTQTTDLNGQKRYRKMETRLIVARPARQRADGSYEQTALFGTYKWNEAETEATLQNRPYRDGDGFRDEVVPFIVDERLDDEVLRKGPKNQLAARLAAGSMRNYAIPGFDRCVHCHMGAVKQDFVLGFIPLQIHRRPKGEGGVIEEAAQDELNQLQRLIDYGVITGIDSPEEIAPLEESQGGRKPRNEHELSAQGYMLGNCAHCHNPQGFPSIKEPVLRDVLNFMPGTDNGGIFQFPLDKFSPRAFRGDKRDVPIPYITPSMYDLNFETLGLDGWTAYGSVAKWIFDQEAIEQDPTVAAKYDSAEIAGEHIAGGSASRLSAGRPLLAPWRSLIYRNVDAPFSYEEAGTVFPHMPMDTPGYDCRVRQVLATWMVSIPARWKSDGKGYTWKTPPDPETNKTQDVTSHMAAGEGLYEFFFDPEPQPYTETSPDAPGYVFDQLAAEQRVQLLQKSPRFNDCPSGDILDPVVAAAGAGVPGPQDTKDVPDSSGEKKGHYTLATPARPHYFETDLRQDQRWIIRRGDWYRVLVPAADDDGDPYNNDQYLGADTRDWRKVYDALQQTRLHEGLRAFALNEVPFGLWLNKSECAQKFANNGVKAASEFQRTAGPSWMEFAAGLKPDAPVYSISPGAEVFDMICSKCHGPKADGQSTLASTMADMSGGLTRVANLRDGLFGPPNSPGANRNDPTIGFKQPNLGSLNGIPLTVDDWAARYAVWMGLGGTRANIPKAAVASIGVTDILGLRSGIKLVLDPLNPGKAANMLEIAKLSCMALVPDKPTTDRTVTAVRMVMFDPARGQLVKDPAFDGTSPTRVQRAINPPGKVVPLPGYLHQGNFYSLPATGLIVSNGHAELWEGICSLDNPLPVRLVSFETDGSKDFFYVSGLYRRTAYPAGAPVGDGTGKIAGAGLSSDNTSPWCVVKPAAIPMSDGTSSAILVERFESYKRAAGRDLPICPDEVASLESEGRIQQYGEPTDIDDDVERWAIRGAMNAGMSVFVYLDALSKGLVKPKPAFNHCEDLAD